MLQQYYGSSAIEQMPTAGRFERSPLLEISRTASHGQNLDLFGNKRRNPTPVRGGSLDIPSQTSNDRVNVSGKVFEFTREELEIYPESLLAKQSRAGRYYDFDRKDYFFDRSRVAFNSIYTFYQYRGAVVFPENYPEQLLIDEFHFFGLYEYLEESQKRHFVKPSEMEKVAVVPRKQWQLFVWHLLEHPDYSLASKVVSILTLLVIAFSIVIMCLDTLPSLGRQQQQGGLPLEHVNNSSQPVFKSQNTMRSELFAMETFCIVYFTIEIILRFIVSPVKLQFWLKALNKIDLIAILPYYLILGLERNYSDTATIALRIFRLFRAIRVLKVSRYISGMKVLGQTLREAFSDLWMIAFLTVIGTLLFASCVFYFENIWDPGTAFDSIPLSLWWSIVTISTIGYGDMAPKTLAGKLVGSMCAISGILLIAPLLPIVYERWQRYYQLDVDGKKIKAGQKLLRYLEKKKTEKAAKKDSKTSSKDTNRELSDKLKNESNEASNPSNPSSPSNRQPTTTAEDEVAENPSKKEEKVDDDMVWTHIKRASIKRRESSSNMMRSADNKTPPRRASDSFSRKGKDIVNTKKPSVSETLVEAETPPKPIFTFTDSESAEKAETDWDKPGPSNVVY